ncbi:MAG: hypothetical protein PHF84_01155 [bacterium]|nr:hypothetical protein [bacterium]
MVLNLINNNSFDATHRALKEAMHLHERFIQQMLNLQKNIIRINVQNKLSSGKVDVYA